MRTQSGCYTDKEKLTITLKHSAIHRELSEMAFQNIVFYWFQLELFMAWFLVTTVYINIAKIHTWIAILEIWGKENKQKVILSDILYTDVSPK